MAGFPLKRRTFSYCRLFNPKYENVSFALHPRNFVRREHWRRNNYPLQKVFLYDPTLIHNTSTNRQTDGRTRDKATMV